MTISELIEALSTYRTENGDVKVRTTEGVPQGDGQIGLSAREHDGATFVSGQVQIVPENAGPFLLLRET